jgi:hypothetical protein
MQRAIDRFVVVCVIAASSLLVGCKGKSPVAPDQPTIPGQPYGVSGGNLLPPSSFSDDLVYVSPVTYLDTVNGPVEIPAGAFKVHPISTTPGAGSTLAPNAAINFVYSFEVACGTPDLDGGYMPSMILVDEAGNPIPRKDGAGAYGGASIIVHPCEGPQVDNGSPLMYNSPLVQPTAFGWAVIIYTGEGGDQLVKVPPIVVQGKFLRLGPAPVHWQAF